MKSCLPLALLLFPAAGCIQRSVHIESDPPGARVFFDHEEAGETPLNLRFTHYGNHSLILTKEGFRPYRGRLELNAKGWAVFPVDIFTEALLPHTMHDRRNATISLHKAEGGEPPHAAPRE